MIAHSIIDQFHSMLMDDDEFNEAVQRIALEVAEEALASGRHDEEDAYELAMELCIRLSVA